MAAQKRKKNCSQKFYGVLIQPQLIKIHNSLDSLTLYRRLLENPKAGGSRELFIFLSSLLSNFHKTSISWRPGNETKT